MNVTIQYSSYTGALALFQYVKQKNDTSNSIIKFKSSYQELISFTENIGPDNGFCHRIGITIGRGPTIFQVAFAVFCALAWYSDTRSPMSHTGRECVDVGGLMTACQPSAVVCSVIRVVHADMVIMSFRQLLYCFIHVFNATLFSHCFSAVDKITCSLSSCTLL